VRKGLRKEDEAKGYNRRRHLIAISLICVSIVLSYSNSFNGTWALDDVLANRPVGINSLHDLIGFRKIAYLTFLLNQYIVPFSTASFRLFNVLVHILNTILIYILAYKTTLLFFERKRISEGYKKTIFTPTEMDQAFSASVLSSVIFALHPININAVAYIIQRMASLATLFILLSLILYMSAVRAKGVKATIFFILGIMSLVLAIFSKENAIMGVPLIILYDWFFLNTDKALFRKRLFLISGTGIIVLLVVSYLLRLHETAIKLIDFFIRPSQPLTRQGWMAVDVYWSPIQHVFTEFRVVTRYIFLISFPLPQFLVFDWWSFPVSRGFTEPVTTLLSAIFLILLLAFSILKAKRFPFLSFGILWYFISISIVSFFAIGSDLYFEHRNYMPFAGLIIGLVGQVAVSFGGRLYGRRLWLIALVLSIILGSLTFTRNFIWKDSITLWRDTLEKTPDNLRAMMSMGNAYMKLSDTYNAERYYKNVLVLSENKGKPYFFSESAFSLGMLYLFNGRLNEAKEMIEKLNQKVESYKVNILRGYYRASNGDIEGALKEYTSIINETRDIDRVIVLTLMGDAYREKGLLKRAIKLYRSALGIEPTFAAAYYGMGASYLRQRDTENAYKYLNKALSIDPHHVLALSDMADLTLITRKDIRDALRYAQRAVSRDTSYYQPYFTMANVLLYSGREHEADVYYKKALEHGMKDYMVSFGKARTYYMKGEMEKTEYYIQQLSRYKNLPERIKGLIK